jgi:RecA/RadA recombinase
MNTLSTLTPSLDRLLNGGFPKGYLSLIYGEASTGKTTLSLQCAVSASRRNWKTLYIDADQSFSHKRLIQIMGSSQDDLLENILIFIPQSFLEQSRIVENLENYLTKKVGLIVVDTMTSLYRTSFGNTQGTFSLNRELNRQLAYLVEIASKYDLVVLITSQVRSKVDDMGSRIEPVARRTLFHWPKIILNLRSTTEHNIKESRMDTFQSQDVTKNRCYLKMIEKGLTDFQISPI